MTAPALKGQVEALKAEIRRYVSDAEYRFACQNIDAAVALTLAFGEQQLFLERERIKELSGVLATQAARIEMLEGALKQAAEFASHPLQMAEPLKNFADIREVSRNALGERK